MPIAALFIFVLVLLLITAPFAFGVPIFVIPLVLVFGGAAAVVILGRRVSGSSELSEFRARARGAEPEDGATT